MTPCTSSPDTPVAVSEAQITQGPWYAFIDGLRDEDGNRVSFESVWDALVCIVVSFVMAAVFPGLWLVVVLIQGLNVVAIVFAVVLAPSGGLFAVAALITCLHAIQDLGKLLVKRWLRSG